MLDRFLAQVKLLPNLFVAGSAGDQFEYLAFSLG
jgi:hypothetical protein